MSESGNESVVFDLGLVFPCKAARIFTPDSKNNVHSLKLVITR